MRKLERATPERLNEIRLWLIGFKAGFVPLYGKARRLVPESVWQTYAMTGIKGNHEQNELKLACQAIRLEWMKRPEELKRTPNAFSPTAKSGQSGKGTRLAPNRFK